MMSLFFGQKRNIPKKGAGKYQSAVFILCALSLLFFVLARYIPLKQGERVRREMIRASEIMGEALALIRECRKEKGIALDKTTDFNQTGLVGVEFSSITTSLGNLEAKKTTTNPNFAALTVFLLKQAGVERGDAIAVGASGSFPALIVAVLSASKAMGLKVLMICSLGASQWGANIPDFHWLHMQSCLQEAGLFNTPPIAISLGGEKDTGMDMTPEGRTLLLNDAEEWGSLFLHEPRLRNNVQERMRIYGEKGGKGGIKAFLNIGGSLSNMGTDARILKLKPGLISFKSFPPVEKRGVMHEMALRKIPVIHLLYIRGLVRRYRLPWDPSPLPQPGKGEIYILARETPLSFSLIAVLYFLLVTPVFIWRKKVSRMRRGLRKGSGLNI